MPIYPSQVNVGGLISTSGAGTPSLNLPLWGTDQSSLFKPQYDSLLALAELQQRYAQLANQKDIQRMGDETSLAMNKLTNDTSLINNQNTNQTNLLAGREANQTSLLTNQNTNQTSLINNQNTNQTNLTTAQMQQGLGYDQLAAQQQQNQATNQLRSQELNQQAAFQQGSLDNEKSKNEAYAASVALTNAIQMDKLTRERQGALTANVVLSGLRDPSSIDSATKASTAVAVKMGDMTQQEADAINSLPAEQKMAFALQHTMLMEQGSQFVNQMQQNSPGSMLAVAADGSMIPVGNIPKEQVSDAQSKITAGNAMMQYAEQLKSAYSKHQNYIGPAKAIPDVAGQAIHTIIPGFEDTTHSSREDFNLSAQAGLTSLSQALDNAKLGVKTVESLVPKASDDAETIKNKIAKIEETGLSIQKTAYKQLGPQGQKLAAELEAKTSSETKSSDSKFIATNGERKFTSADIEKIAQANGISSDDVLKQLKSI